MDGNNWWPVQGEPPSMEASSSDWRSQLQPEARQRIVNKIMDTLRRHLPVVVPEGMTELKKIAVRFEEKIYTAAVNQSDYLRKISLKMLSMESKTQNTPMYPQPGVNQNSIDTASIDSTDQIWHNGADWKEEIYQKIQALKDAHLAELQEFHLKILQRYQQNEMLPHAKKSDTPEELKSFKMLLERMLAFLQISKNSITIGSKEKLPMYEKQIIGLLSLNRRQKPMPLQQLQPPGGHAQSTPQHQPFQVLQVQKYKNHGNQVYQMNMPGSITTMQSAVTSSMQNGSMALPSLAAPATQQNSTSSVQSASGLDPVQVNSFGLLQQGLMGSVQQSGVGLLQNSVCAAQKTNLNNLSQSSLSGLQPNATLMQNSNVLQQQQHQLRQCVTQQLLVQEQQRQQQKQLQASQLPVHQMSQFHAMNELNELMVRKGSGIKPGIYQLPFAGVRRPNYYHQQLKSGASFPDSSPQNLQASSPQISRHSLPLIDHHAVLPNLTKAGTPMQSTGSPFVVLSPSTSIVPSPIPGDSEKLVYTVVSLPTTGETTHQQTSSAPLQSQSIPVATPGISASPLLAEFTSQEGNLSIVTNASRAASEQPLERLIKAGAAASSSEAWLLRYIRYLRISAIVLTMIAAVSVGFSKLTNQSIAFNSLAGVTATYSSISIKAIDSSSFLIRYFMFVNVFVFAYSVVLTIPSFLKKYGTRLELAITDLIAVIFLITANTAAAVVTEDIAWNGNSHYDWNKFCNLPKIFCGTVTGSIVISSMAAAIYFVMTVLSIIIIHRKSQY